MLPELICAAAMSQKTGFIGSPTSRLLILVSFEMCCLQKQLAYFEPTKSNFSFFYQKKKRQLIGSCQKSKGNGPNNLN